MIKQVILTKKKGFSLLELVIVVGLIVVIGSIGAGFYANYGKNIEISSTAETISFDLKQAQSKSMIGQGGFLWGVHFINPIIATDPDYYEIFSTPTNYADGGRVTVSTNYLPSSIQFSSPASGFNTDIIFNRISGGTAASSVTLVSQGNTKTISVSTLGGISIQ